MPTAQQQQSLHPLPVIGYPETYYAKHIQEADKAGDAHAHAAYKVGQYVTLALDHKIGWEEKLRFVKHTLKHHCSKGHDGDEQVKQFYGRLCELVKRHAGQEALRMARAENDSYNLRVDTGTPREEIEGEADVFFTGLMGHTDTPPEWFTKEAWAQLKQIRDRWI